MKSRRQSRTAARVLGYRVRHAFGNPAPAEQPDSMFMRRSRRIECARVPRAVIVHVARLMSTAAEN